jgi:hypothetical protein
MMDKYTEAYIKVNIHIDAGSRAWCKGKQLEVHMIGGERKVLLPISKILFTFDDLKRAGAKVDVITLKSLAQAGADGRWKENIEQRRQDNIPRNVYVANARTIQLAIDAGKVPPPTRWVGRKKDQITEVRDTVDEVIDDMANDRWRTEFSRGGRAKRKVTK